MWTYIKNIFQLIISPDNGWDDIAAAGKSRGDVVSMGWMVMIAAASVFVPLFYTSHSPLLAMCQLFVAVNVSLWATYFIADNALSWVLPRLCDGVYDEKTAGTFTAYSVGLLSLQILLSDILPVTFAILELWPMYVVVIMWRGMKILDCQPAVTGKYLLLVILAFVGTSQLLLRIFNHVILK